MRITCDQRTAKAQALAAYRSTFVDFARQAHAVQDLTAEQAVDGSTVDGAMLALEKAYAVYVERRNAFASFLLPAHRRHIVGLRAARADRDSQTRRVARLLWEVSGRPLDSATEDWRRAEEIVRALAAA